MIFVHGIALPEYDTHFSLHILKEMDKHKEPGYQTKKWLRAVPLIGQWRNAVDVGAHVGLWTRKMAPRFQSVLAFEPVPELAECWEANCAGMPATLERIALGNRTGPARIVPVTDNSGNAYITNDPGAELRSLSIDMQRLDDRGLDAVDFIKIDVEGYEAEVIRGAEATIKRNKPVIVVEQKPHNGSRYGRSDTEAVDLLQSWGAKLAWEIAGDYAFTW